jgi:hypothetical protein
LQTASLEIPIIAPNKSACTVEHCILAISVIGILNRISSAFVSLDSKCLSRLESTAFPIHLWRWIYII